MKLPAEIMDIITAADCRLLATAGADGPNAVPLSMVIFEPDRILICDCFMVRTVENLRLDNRVSAAFWKGFVGVQVKGRVDYKQSGEEFDRAAVWLSGKHPDRVLKGVLVLEPEAVYDLAPGRGGVKIA